MACHINSTAISTCKTTGFHSARIENGKLVAEYFGLSDYCCVLGPDGHGYMLIGPDEISATHSFIFDVDDSNGTAIRIFETVGHFAVKALKFIGSREEVLARAAKNRELEISPHQSMQ